jgi:hypothetical protein
MWAAYSQFRPREGEDVMMKLFKRLQEKLEGTMSAVAFAEEGEVETARQMVAEVSKDEAKHEKPATARPVQPISLPRPEHA